MVTSARQARLHLPADKPIGLNKDNNMKVLLTGASGAVATMIRPLLLSTYSEVVLSDREAPAQLQPGETFIAAQLDDPGQVAALMSGIDAIVHLGGQSVEAAWPVVLQSNIVGLYNVYEAARVAGVSRIVFASSNHAIGLYPREQLIDHTVPVKPDSRYGVSTTFGVEMGSMYAHNPCIKITDLRIAHSGY